MREFLKFLPFFSSFIVPLKTRVLKFFWNVLRPKVFVLIVAFNLESHLHPDIGVKHVLAFLFVILMMTLATVEPPTDGFVTISVLEFLLMC